MKEYFLNEIEALDSSIKAEDYLRNMPQVRSSSMAEDDSRFGNDFSKPFSPDGAMQTQIKGCP